MVDGDLSHIVNIVQLSVKEEALVREAVHKHNVRLDRVVAVVVPYKQPARDSKGRFAKLISIHGANFEIELIYNKHGCFSPIDWKLGRPAIFDLEVST